MSTENNKMQEELKKNFQESPEYAIVHVDDEEPLRNIFADHISSLGIKIFSIDSPGHARGPYRYNFIRS